MANSRSFSRKRSSSASPKPSRKRSKSSSVSPKRRKSRTKSRRARPKKIKSVKRQQNIAKTRSQKKGIFAEKEMSNALKAVVSDVGHRGNKISRTEATRKIWQYIKKHDLQGVGGNKRMIKTDAKLRGIFPTSSLSMFKMAGMLTKHLS